MTPGRRGWIVLAIGALLALNACAHPVFAADAPHAAHGADHFYATWMQPDAPWVSCCHNDDCAPAQARLVDGHWEARWTDADEWVRIPDEKVERARDMPDGQAHLCGRRSRLGEFMVFCFGTGAGG